MGIKYKSIFIVVFLTAYLAFSLNWVNTFFGKNVYELQAYPFAKFQLYANLAIEGDDDFPYCENGIQYDVSSDLPAAEEKELERRMLRSFYFMAYHSWKDSAAKDHLGSIMGMLKDNHWLGHEAAKIRSVSASLVKYEFVRYPEQAHLKVIEKTFLGKITRDHVFTSNN